MVEKIEISRPDGQKLNAFLAQPAQPENAPGIVVIQEWWGVNDQIKGVAQRFADAGFVALIPDLYRGKVTADAVEANDLMNGLDFGDAAAQDVRACVQHLKKSSPKAGVTGFSMGGALTLLSMANVPEADGGVVWYGYPPLEFLDTSAIKAPILAHWATQDTIFAIDGVDALEEKFHENGVDYSGHRYHAHHSFACETAHGHGRIDHTAYDPTWCQAAYDRSMVFLARNLG